MGPEFEPLGDVPSRARRRPRPAPGRKAATLHLVEPAPARLAAVWLPGLPVWAVWRPLALRKVGPDITPHDLDPRTILAKRATVVGRVSRVHLDCVEVRGLSLVLRPEEHSHGLSGDARRRQLFLPRAAVSTPCGARHADAKSALSAGQRFKGEPLTRLLAIVAIMEGVGDEAVLGSPPR